MSDFLKGLVVASLEEIENGDGAPAEAVSDEVIEAIEAAITAVNEAHDEVVASSSDVEKLEDIANALQETLVVAQESLVDGVLPAYAQQFMTVSLRHAYRRIGLESETETVNETPATDEAPAPVVAEVADTVPVAEGGTDATEHGPGVPEVEPATPVDAEVPETGTAEPIATLPVESHGTTEAPVVPESNSMSMESFGDNVKAFFAALIKALKAAWEKVKAFFKRIFSSVSVLEKGLDAAASKLKSVKDPGKKSCHTSFGVKNITSLQDSFKKTLSELRKLADLNKAHLGVENVDEFAAIQKVVDISDYGIDYTVPELKSSVNASKHLLKEIEGAESDVEAIAKVIDELELKEPPHGSDVGAYRIALQKQMALMRKGEHLLTRITSDSFDAIRYLILTVKRL